MKREEVLGILGKHRNELRRVYHVKSLALFGSVARNEAANTSDVDLLVEFDQPVGLFHLAGTELFIRELLGVEKVDLIIRDSVFKELRETIYGEAIDVIRSPTVEISPSAHS